MDHDLTPLHPMYLTTNEITTDTDTTLEQRERERERFGKLKH